MGVLSNQWNEQQIGLYLAKVSSINAAAAAFVTVLTQYAVSEWIWYGDEGGKRKPHRAPVYLASSVPFFYLWSTIFNMLLGYTTIAYCIATPLVAYGGVLLNLAFYWIWARAFPLKVDSEESEAEATGPETEDVKEEEEEKPLTEDTEAPAPKIDDEPAPAPAPTKKPILLYINNIKIFLTAMVLMHHCMTYFSLENEYLFAFRLEQTGDAPSSFAELWSSGGWFDVTIQAFIFVNQCYFMSLFYFFSGFFVPRSFDKKGMKTFLMGRSRRLGIPLVLLAYTGTCARNVLEWALHSGGTFPWSDKWNSLIWSPDQGWFLFNLMIYGTVYAFACGKGWSPKISCPSILGFFAISVALGLWSTFVSVFLPMGAPTVLNVPESPSVSLLHLLFFFYGAVAQRNNWMEEIKSKSRVVIYSWAFVSFVGGFTVLTKLSLPDLQRRLQSDEPTLQPVLVTAFMMNGYLSVPMSLAVTVFFMDFFNKKYFFTDFFAKSMYTAYIIQRFPIVIGMYLCTLLFEATNNLVGPEFADGRIVYTIPANMAIPAFLFMVAFTMLVTWPLAYGIRSIPGFSKVL
mmetsp:Transcript_14752/g.37110  ORF Transcript_14752/g.37110 Transcript_14752/m.37110 type:complete len:571 (-) Transcript_14752:83-1795(-)